MASSKKKKRSILDLVEQLGQGRPNPGGFDLIGEGNAFLAGGGSDFSSSERSVDKSAAVKMSADKSTTVNGSVDESATVKMFADKSTPVEKSANESTAVEVSTDKSTPVEKSANESTAVEVSTDKSTPVEKSANESTAVEVSTDKSTPGEKSVDESATVKMSTDKSTPGEKPRGDESAHEVLTAKMAELSDQEGRVAANFQSHRRAIHGVCELRKIRKKIQFDSYIFDSLILRINSPSASLIYIYLYRRTIGEGEAIIQISGTVLGEALGFSSKAVRSAIKHLIGLGLLEVLPSEKSSITASYRVLASFD